MKSPISAAGTNTPQGTVIISSEQSKIVLRDLQWAVESPVLCGVQPVLLSNQPSPSNPQWSQLAEQSPILWARLVGQRRIPIGRYFEGLIAFWLQQQSTIHSLQQNIQVPGPSGTVGELDLLFHSQHRSHHWELALKFYLGLGDRSLCNHWYGPMGRDRLDLKLDKLYSHQLRLPYTDQGRTSITGVDVASLDSCAIVKGYLFHPHEEWQIGRFITPSQIHPGHEKGWWLRLSSAQTLLQEPAVVGWRWLQKCEWLARATATNSTLIIAPRDLRAWLSVHFASTPRPPLLAAIGTEGNEIHRGFVVSDSWPQAVTL